MRTYILMAVMVLCGCGGAAKVKAQDPEPVSAADQLLVAYGENKARAEALRDPVTKWLMGDDCDGFLWESEYNAAPGVAPSNLAAAEFPDHPGKFGRRPVPCWTPERGDEGARSSWSGDMGKGLALYAWRTKDLGMIERHVDHGEDNATLTDGFPTWRMGDPGSEWGVYYKPAQVGLMYQVRWALGGSDHLWRHIPGHYPSGLDDYQAKLQVLDIMVRGEISEARGEPIGLPQPKIPRTAAAATTDVSEGMMERLEEHAAREPENPLYAYAVGVYTGSMDRAVELCLRPDMPGGSYLRCHTLERCRLAEWMLACGSTLRRLGKI